jgi:hypothetical protein
MKITKKKGMNDYSISGLTLGKISCFHEGLKRLERSGLLTTLERECLRELDFHFENDSILQTENMFN